tara:strand:- start:314 stop:481 length:168 start_codon:yes stop_codon:yes gene_type:complete
MGYIVKTKGTSGQTYYGGKDPKKESIANKTGTGKKYKQSPGFLDMVVDYVKEKLN